MIGIPYGVSSFRNSPNTGARLELGKVRAADCLTRNQVWLMIAQLADSITNGWSFFALIAIHNAKPAVGHMEFGGQAR